ncbi:MAG: VWA domain-containing protein [Pirellulaceae bacterium]|nr:VWA domain-containing protein [Pirellulaceae bacterium]
MSDTREFYEWMRLQTLDQWWHWIVLALVLIAILSYAIYWYRRDWIELPRSLGWALLLLRITALCGIAVFFFDLQKRSEQRLVRPSRLAILVDTSLSMSLPMENIPTAAGAKNRMETVIEFFSKSPVLHQLQALHDVSIYRFDQTQRPALIASFSKPKKSQQSDSEASRSSTALWKTLSRVVWGGTIFGGVALLGLVIAMGARVTGSKAPAWPYVALLSVVAVVAAIAIVGTATLRGSYYPVGSLWAFEEPNLDELDATTKQLAQDSGPKPAINTVGNEAKGPEQIDWPTLLMASGVETRLGDAIQSIVEQERGTPLSGIVILTDGQSNSGVDPVAAASMALSSNIPIFAIGLGDPNDPINVRLVDLEAPKRVYPGDRFRITALVQATGLAGKKCSIQIRRRSAGGSSENLAIEEEIQIELGSDEELKPVSFDVVPREIGSWLYDVKLLPPSQDTNTQDNSLDAEVRVVEPRSTVLIIAGGPTREYQFVRNLLFRDKTVQSHVFLQTGGPGMSQEANKLLTDFPKSQLELSEYDCVIAFDADWMALSVPQIEALEKWVSQQAGGLISILGPVASPQWTGTSGNGDRRAEILRNLSPVVLNGRGTRLVSMGRFESETIWPLKFTDNARGMDFIQITNDAETSQAAWSNFSGVYSFYASYEPKPGALPLAYFSDPATSFDGKLPVYLATQFYGAGRVAFQGSGEMWRMRQLSDDYFDTYYTKLIRWVSQSRLLRDSDRGMLLLDKQQALVGEQINVRAVLRDEQFQPLILPNATARLYDPSGRNAPLELMPLQDVNQLGTYVATFLAKQTGSYEVRLPIGNLSDRQVLSQQVTVRVPTREIQRPQRNDRLLTELAEKTGGAYLPSLANASEPVSETTTQSDPSMKNQSITDQRTSGESTMRIVSMIAPREQVNFLPGAPDRQFQQRLMGTLMALIGTALSLEWLLRRLSKLA